MSGKLVWFLVGAGSVVAYYHFSGKAPVTKKK